MIDLTKLSAREVADQVRGRKTSAVEVTQAALDQISRLNERLRAFLIVTADAALEEARRVDRDVAAGKTLPLAGVPLAVKDSFWVKGIPTRAGSPATPPLTPDEDATAVARLRAAGCVVVGKASMHEMAYGFTNQNPHYGDCKNPWNVARVPGGSSGGNGTAVATGMALAAIGGDTGGSIRLPAALCGIVGLKVTYGRVSGYGGIPLSWSMDTVGPMARTVGDAAAMLQVMAGRDPKDRTTSLQPVADYQATLGQGVKGVRLGIPHDHFFEAIEPSVAAALQAALDVLKKAGATLVEARLPPIEPVIGAHRAIIFTEASTAHETLVRTRASVLGDDVRPLLQAGFFIPSNQYLGAQQARQKIIAAYREAWRPFDILVTPSSPIVAPPFGATTAKVDGEDRPLLRLCLDRTLPFNLTGQPGLSVPCGFSPEGLPIGLQLVGRPFEEALLLQVGAAYEQATDWHRRVPEIAART